MHVFTSKIPTVRSRQLYAHQCQAVVLHEWNRNKVHYARCQLGSTQKVEGRCFCRKHARLAREGFVNPRTKKVASQDRIQSTRLAREQAVRAFRSASAAWFRG